MEPPSIRSASEFVAFASASFLSSGLLFMLQPIAGKALLPVFGGSPATWISCILFFQMGLLGGYLYAHVLLRRLSEGRQRLVHTVALFAACLLLPINPSQTSRLTERPEWAIPGSLAIGVGGPYFLLSASGPLLQGWYRARFPSRSPYPLYALGNAGSLLGLMVFPFVLEPFIGTRALSLLWSGVFILAACLLVVSASIRTRRDALDCESPDAATHAAHSPPLHDRVLWWLLPCAGSIVLLAITNHLSQDIAAVPMLWILPLALYLLSYILAFYSPRKYSRRLWLWLLGIGTVVLATLRGSLAIAHPELLIASYGAFVFICCMVCHGELVRTRPHPRYLTSFYIGCAGGGALGGLFVSLVAPTIFDAYVELPLGIYLAVLLAVVGALRERDWTIGRVQMVPATVLVFMGVIAVTAAWLGTAIPGSEVILQKRNFFGITRVIAHEHDESDRHLVLYHGTTIHGMQFMADPIRTEPTSYYGRESGAGIMLSELGDAGRPAGRRIGVIGLGAGTLAAYGRPGDTMRFYEIDPNVIEVATHHFDFLGRSPAAIETVLGDARTRLENEAPQRFDVLVVDAFSGDAIPVHLLTIEAFRLYQRHLRADGVLVVHLSNRYLNLAPIVWAIAEKLDLERAIIRAPANEHAHTLASVYAVLSPSIGRLGSRVIRSSDEPSSLDGRGSRVWTDDYSSLLAALD